MSHLATANELFFKRAGLDEGRTERIVREALAGTDDGELFLEYAQSEMLAWDDGKLKSASFDTTQGFGLRAVKGETVGYAHASSLDEGALKRAATTVRAVASGKGGTAAEGPRGTNSILYTDSNPLDGIPFERKVKLLEEIDAYARGKEPLLKQVSA